MTILSWAILFPPAAWTAFPTDVPIKLPDQDQERPKTKDGIPCYEALKVSDLPPTNSNSISAHICHAEPNSSY